ncbi:pentatricopeptide repeat-containing protein At3g26782, mitochondrial-like [Euphorbia lathyris]|uniref:pentatricopeptide repeat-containing protein At3g26782, mitochondrial-like n=1 Tax=Euphorbia lathyris TaxID=212925 RepID=UPI0033138875
MQFVNLKQKLKLNQCRLLWAEAQKKQVELKPNTCISVIKRCLSLTSLKMIHASMLRSHLHLNPFFFTTLISQYISLHSISHAYSLFSSSLSFDPFLWNVLLRAFVDLGYYNRAIHFYHQMLHLAIPPNNFTFPFVIKACAFLQDIRLALQLHHHVLQFGYHLDLFVANSLITMYAKCQTYEISRLVFDTMPHRNVVSWNAIIGSCSLNARYEEGLSLFWRMLREGFRPNRVAILNVMTCIQGEKQAHDIYRLAVANGLDVDQFVLSAAIGMYARCGRLDLARNIFDGIFNKDLVTWSSLIEAYAQTDNMSLEALSLFKVMISRRIFPDSVTLRSVVRACSVVASFQRARAAHGIIVVTDGFFSDKLAVQTCVIDLYVKCGSLMYARKVFDRMQDRNIISWSTMISGYGIHGDGREALNLFNQMKTSIRPDHIAFVSILSACSHAGLVDQGWDCFNSMARDFGVIPRTEHYACMVDLLGRAGKLNEAHDFIERMPIKPDAAVWGALLGACRTHSQVDLAEMAAKALFDLDARNPGRYILLSNIYASSGKIKDANRIRSVMKDRGIRKIAGHTIIEVKNKVYTFVAGDRSQPQTGLIYLELERLMDRIREEGYTPDTNFVLHDVEEETKEKMLYVHSEKLAIVFGLLNSGAESVIRIRKNLRVCGDCHTATKFISKVTRREIVVRDARRFHHFKDGACSCGDYW